MTLSKIVPGLSLFAVLLAAPAARAQACATDTDCPGGTTCQSLPTPSAGPTCAGPDCPVSTDQGIAAPTAPTKACAPAPCSVDADCGGGGRVCQHDKVTVCNGGTAPACPRDQACDTGAAKPEVATCVERTVSACVYRWQLPCNADADCGDGFTCAPNIISMCSGGTPISGGAADAGSSGSVDSATGRPTPVAASGSGVATDLPAPAPSADGGVSPERPMCTTMESFPGYCRAKATTCTTDADCPAAWSCATGAVPPSGSGSGTSGSTGSGSSSDAGKRAAAETGATVPADLVATVKSCQAPAAFPPRGAYATDTTTGSTAGSKTPPSGTPTGAGAGNGLEGERTSSPGNAGCAVGGRLPGSAPLAAAVGLALAVAAVVVRRRRR